MPENREISAIDGTASVREIAAVVQGVDEQLPFDELAAAEQHVANAAGIVAQAFGAEGPGIEMGGALTGAAEHLEAAGSALLVAHGGLTRYVQDITGESITAHRKGEVTSGARQAEAYVYTDEKTLFTERVKVLEREAAAGVYTGGKPVDVLVGIELEGQFIEDGTFLNSLDERIPAMEIDTRLMARQMVRPSKPVRSLPDEERIQLLEDGRRQAREYVEGIPAYTDEERARKQQWLEGIDQYGPKELACFELYREFSVPIADVPVVPANASYEDVARYSSERGWLEFRWGPEAGQVGWEDTPGVVETRLTPCLPSEAAHRKNIVMQRFGDIAAKYGMAYMDRAAQLNVSAYQENEAGQRMPIIGLDPERREQTLDVLAGMSAGITDGLWLNTSIAQKSEIFDVTGEEHVTRHVTSHTRTSIRLHIDHAELRDTTLIGSVEQGLAWALGGTLAGLRDGHATYEASGYEVPQVTQTHRVLRNEGFNKKAHVDIQRAFEQSERAEDGGFILSDHHNFHFAQATAQAFIGLDGMSPPDAFMLNDILMRSMRVDDQGRVRCPLDILQANFANMSDYHKSEIGWIAERAENVAGLAEHHVQSVRIVPTEVIPGGGAYAHLSPANREQRLLNSPVAQLALGEGLSHFAAGVRRVGEHARATQSREDVFARLKRGLQS